MGSKTWPGSEADGCSVLDAPLTEGQRKNILTYMKKTSEAPECFNFSCDYSLNPGEWVGVRWTTAVLLPTINITFKFGCPDSDTQKQETWQGQPATMCLAADGQTDTRDQLFSWFWSICSLFLVAGIHRPPVKLLHSGWGGKLGNWAVRMMW